MGARSGHGLDHVHQSERPAATAPAQIVGTYNTANGTWLWAWDNPSINPNLTLNAEITREYGEKRGISELTDARWRRRRTMLGVCRIDLQALQRSRRVSRAGRRHDGVHYVWQSEGRKVIARTDGMARW